MCSRITGLVLLTAVACLNVACGESRQSRINDRTYMNFKQNISLDFPKGWTVDESGMMGSIVIFREQRAGKGFVSNINVFSEVSELSLDEYANITKQNMGRFFSGFEFYSQSSQKINGLDARVVEYSFKQGNAGYIKQRSYYVKREGKIFVITCSAGKEEFEKYLSVFEGCANTLKMI